MIKKILSSLLIYCCLFTSLNSIAAIPETELFNNFVRKMVEKHQFDKAELNQLFKSVEIKNNIIKTMKRPAEGLPWYKYRKIFMTDTRVNKGVKFWQEHQNVLATVATNTGVPAEIIVAIIGVETQYGGNTGHHRVIDALATLGFAYPKRSKFFLSELENFLLLCREEKMNPLEPTGSYAGAMGIPQFMPSSYRAYAADYENDEKRDIWNNPADAIASVANYFVKHHWSTNKEIVFPVQVEGDGYQKALSKGLKPDMKWAELQSLSVSTKEVLKADEKVKLLAYQQQKQKDLWVGLHNFYVITRYNHSALYAMAVYQLSDAILKQKQLSEAEKKQRSKIEPKPLKIETPAIINE